MGQKEIRIGQLIAPFGPGSIYTDRKAIPHIMCGLDFWFMGWNEGTGMVECNQRSEFEVVEPRLSNLLGVNRFCRPPDHRTVRRGERPPQNAGLLIPAHRFPRWYRHSKTGHLRRFNLGSNRLERPANGGRWLPVRFISVCDAGHLCEFPWKEWIGCNCPGDGELILTDRGGSELSSINIKCNSCPSNSQGRNGRNLAGTTMRPNEEEGETSAFQRANISCTGDRPWLGEDANEVCNRPLVGALINQTNLYFAKTIPAIGLPDLMQGNEGIAELRNNIEDCQGIYGTAKTLWKMGQRSGAIALVENTLRTMDIEASEEDIGEALESSFSSGNTGCGNAEAPAEPEIDLLGFRREEFAVIREGIDNPRVSPNLRVLRSDVPSSFTSWIARVNLVERLRETRVFYGFDRLEQDQNPMNGMPTAAFEQLFRYPPTEASEQWLPAVEVFGEGIYLELDEASIAGWQSSNEEWLSSRLNQGFITRLCEEQRTLPPLSANNLKWASKYLLIHSLSHILINQLVFECGYSTSSLKERLFISADDKAPMAGILIYTSAGDSEGTLGGLVRLGRRENLETLILKALSRASWCSADPVCSENLGGQGSQMANLAACHACILLPETSCETINQGLDRAMVVGTPEHRECGYLSSYLDATLNLSSEA